MRDAGVPKATYHGLEQDADVVLRAADDIPEPAVVVAMPCAVAPEDPHDCTKSTWTQNGSGDWRCSECGVVDLKMRGSGDA